MTDEFPILPEVLTRLAVDEIARVLHIHGQYTHHGAARIAGTREALTALHTAIGDALAKGEAICSPLFANDGEGYSLELQVLDTEAMDKEQAPYIMLDCDHAERYWRERAFQAEAKLYRIKRRLPEPVSKEVGNA